MSTPHNNPDHSNDIMDHDLSEENFMDHIATPSENTFNDLVMITPLDSYCSVRRGDPYVQSSDPYTIISRIEGLEDKMVIVEDDIRGLPSIGDLERLKDQIGVVDTHMEIVNGNLDSVVEQVNDANRDIVREIEQLRTKVRALEEKAGLHRLSMDMTKHRLNKLIRKLHVRMH